MDRKLGGLILMVLAVTSSAVASHSGGTDRYGCHHDRKNGGYHCHTPKASYAPAPSSQTSIMDIGGYAQQGYYDAVRQRQERERAQREASLYEGQDSLLRQQREEMIKRWAVPAAEHVVTDDKDAQISELTVRLAKAETELEAMRNSCRTEQH